MGPLHPIYGHFYDIQVLLAKNVNKRNEVFEATFEMAKEFGRTAKLLGLRSAILKHNVVIKAPTTLRGGQGGPLRYGPSGMFE